MPSLPADLASHTLAVMDASIAIDAAIGEPARKARARLFLSTCDAAGVALVVPPAFEGEADTAVRQLHLRGVLPLAGVPLAYGYLDRLVVDVARDPAELARVRLRARDIAAMLNQPSVYDATYAALAEARGCLFWTADGRFANAAKQGRKQADGTLAPALPHVRYLGDY